MAEHDVHPPTSSRIRRTCVRRYAPVVAGWSVALAGFVAAFVIPFPYVIESPGPTYNVLGETDGKNVIEITGRPEYPARGNLNMTTVYISGGPGSRVKGVDLLKAWAGGESSILPEREVYPETATRDQIAEAGRLEMDNSQSAAIAAALSHEKIAYQSRLVIQEVTADGASAGLLEKGDVVLTVGGSKASDVAGLRKAVAASEGKPVTVVVEREKEKKSVTVRPKEADGRWLLGVALRNAFEFPFKPVFNLQGVGGPSAGMMFALGIIDELTPGDLTGGKFIAGTGTIGASGEVGPIGGIQQKMISAKRDGAQYFLAPSENCGEVVGHVPDGLTVVRVESLDVAYSVVQAIGKGETRETNADHFPSCQ